jgi:hypothetical protein
MTSNTARFTQPYNNQESIKVVIFALQNVARRKYLIQSLDERIIRDDVAAADVQEAATATYVLFLRDVGSTKMLSLEPSVLN